MKLLSVILLKCISLIHANPPTPFPDLATLKAEANTYCDNPDGYQSTEYGNIENWDVSEVTSMFKLFYTKHTCNPDISSWNVGKVTNFQYMLTSARAFNQNVSEWDVSTATNFQSMFMDAASFNQNVSEWDVSNAENLQSIFHATPFNQNISGWNVSKNTKFHAMFYGAKSFNQNISGWDVSKGTDFLYMFNGAISFKQDLTSWPQVARDATAFCGGAICDEAPATDSPTNSPTDNPTNSPTDSPTRSVPVTFTLSPPQCTVDVSNTASVGDVTCAFTGIEGSNDATVSMEIKDYNCVSPYSPSAFENTIVTATTDQAEGVTSYNAVANVDPASGYAGNVKFCVRTDLKDTVSGDTMIFRSEQIDIAFSYDGTFAVAGFSTTPFVGIGQQATVATKNFGVTATVCDSAGTTISSPPALSLGTNLFVCIKTDVAGTKIPSITSFIAKKDTESEYNVATPSPNVVIRGLDSSDVKVVMNLPARFFTDATNIQLSGSVVVARDDSRRNLASSRALTADTSETTFSLDVPVKDNADDKSGSVRANMMISTVIFSVVALFFI